MRVEPFEIVTNGTFTIGVLLIAGFVILAALPPAKIKHDIFCKVASIGFATMTGFLISPLYTLKGILQPVINVLYEVGPLTFIVLGSLTISHFIKQVARSPGDILTMGNLRIVAYSFLLFLVAVFIASAMMRLPDVGHPETMVAPGNVTNL